MSFSLSQAEKGMRRGEATMAASFIGAYFECSPAIQEVVREMIAIVNSDESDPEEIEAACNTLNEALFPRRTAELIARDKALFTTPEFAAAAQELDAEHEQFADRVRQLMDEKGITQVQLAAEAGITQPAVSNILNRNARPQRRTVARFAAALGVNADELWPTDSKDA